MAYMNDQHNKRLLYTVGPDFDGSKFCESLQINVKKNFHGKRFVITFNFNDSVLARSFSSKHARYFVTSSCYL